MDGAGVRFHPALKQDGSDGFLSSPGWINKWKMLAWMVRIAIQMNKQKPPKKAKAKWKTTLADISRRLCSVKPKKKYYVFSFLFTKTLFLLLPISSEPIKNHIIQAFCFNWNGVFWNDSGMRIILLHAGLKVKPNLPECFCTSKWKHKFQKFLHRFLIKCIENLWLNLILFSIKITLILFLCFFFFHWCQNIPFPNKVISEQVQMVSEEELGNFWVVKDLTKIEQIVQSIFAIC